MIGGLNDKISREFAGVQHVFGAGNPHAAVMLVGEAPGREEVEQGKPFVGKAGKNLDEFLQSIDLAREELYVTHAVKFRPVRVSQKGTVANRTPSAREVAAYRPYLLEEIRLIAPKVVVTLGNTPLRSVLGDPKLTIGEVHGKTIALKRATLFALYHPASIIYNRALAEVYREDLAALKAYLKSV